MSLKQVPPNGPSLIISTGVLVAPKSIYKTPLSSGLFSLLTALSIHIPHKVHLKATPFTLPYFLFHKQSWYLLQTCCSNLNPTSLKYQ